MASYRTDGNYDACFLPGDGVQTSSQDGCSYITPRCGHAGYSRPVVCSDVVHLNRVQVRNAIKAPNDIDVVVQ